jgi:hypothetical protein
MRDRIQSSNMGFQALAILSDSARRSIELHRKEYTWMSADRRDVEYDGVTILAIILSRLKPHYKVDLFADIKECKEMRVADYKYNLPNFFDALKDKKIEIDIKSSTAYTDEAYIRDILLQLKSVPIDIFAKEYASLENRWLMGKEVIDPETLIDEAILMYVNLDKTGQWTIGHSAKDQIIALTSEVRALKTKLESVAKPANATAEKTGGNGSGNGGGNGGANGSGPWKFEEWRLTKVDNGKEHSMINKDGKFYYWCEDGHYWNGKECGMYVFHKPGEGHRLWKERKMRSKRDKAAAASTDTSSTAASSDSNSATKKKLSLAQSLQSALVTQAGVSENQFQTIWEQSCSETGN